MFHKDIVKRIKTYSTDWEKIFASHIFNKGLITRMYNDLLKFNNKENNSIKMDKRFEEIPHLRRPMEDNNNKKIHEKKLNIVK